MSSTKTIATLLEAQKMTLAQLEKVAEQASTGDVTFVVACSGNTVFVRRNKVLAPSRYYEFDSLSSAAEFLTGYND